MEGAAPGLASLRSRSPRPSATASRRDVAGSVTYTTGGSPSLARWDGVALRATSRVAMADRSRSRRARWAATAARRSTLATTSQETRTKSEVSLSGGVKSVWERGGQGVG